MLLLLIGSDCFVEYQLIQARRKEFLAEFLVGMQIFSR